MTVEKLIELLNEAGKEWNYFNVYHYSDRSDQELMAGMDGDWDLTKLAEAITKSEKEGQHA